MFVCNYLLHNNHLKFNNSKISKSKGSFLSLADLKKKGYRAHDFRFVVLQTHYRKSLNFTWQSLKAAKNGLNNIIKEFNESNS